MYVTSAMNEIKFPFKWLVITELKLLVSLYFGCKFLYNLGLNYHIVNLFDVFQF